MPLFHKKDRRYRVLYDVHAWLGAVLGLVLYLMFITGITALVWSPLETWEDPGQHHALSTTVDDWWVSLQDEIGDADTTFVSLSLPSEESASRVPVARVMVEGEPRREVIWDGTQWRARRGYVARFLFRVHFLYHEAIPILYTVSGLVALALFIALMTGIAVHLRKIIPEFHQFRPHLPRRAMWADLHKVTGVAGLPFALVIAYTGAVIVLNGLAIASVGLPLYGGDLDRAKAAAFGDDPPTIEAEEEPGPQAPARAWVEAAETALPGLDVHALRTAKPGLATTVVEVSGEMDDAPGRVRVYVSGETAEVLQVRGLEAESAPLAAQRWLFGLHFAQFGGWGLKLVYAVLALFTGATILTGNALWIERRRKQRKGRAHGVLARLTVGVGAGLPLAMGLMLLMSRLLPWNLDARTALLDATFVLTLAGACGYASWSASHRTCWVRMLFAAAATFAAVPLAQATCTDVGLFAGGLTGGHFGMFAAIDLGMLVVAALLALAAWIVRRGPHRTPRPSTPARGGAPS
ncbi:MAG: PepSY-associated TM helix domain-containing protein [Myxococcota bacterium]